MLYFQKKYIPLRRLYLQNLTFFITFDKAYCINFDSFCSSTKKEIILEFEMRAHLLKVEMF